MAPWLQLNKFHPMVSAEVYVDALLLWTFLRHRRCREAGCLEIGWSTLIAADSAAIA
jgi:hypothetical protein